MNTPFPTSAIARAAVVALSVGLLGACKPEPPIPTVTPAATPIPDTRSMPRAAPDAPLPDPSKNMAAADSDLAGRIESALNAETSLHGSRIGVIAANGVVTLTGSTRSPDLRSVASHIALSVDGVRLVRNELAIGMET